MREHGLSRPTVRGVLYEELKVASFVVPRLTSEDFGDIMDQAVRTRILFELAYSGRLSTERRQQLAVLFRLVDSGGLRVDSGEEPVGEEGAGTVC